MRAVFVMDKPKSGEVFSIEFSDVETFKRGADECIVEVHGSSVNPSDAKALLGKMPNLVWPRIPGRDYAGTVVDGPSGLLGKNVWGSGGDLGMSRNGAHAELILVKSSAIQEKPANLSMLEAGAIGVPWTCAWLGMVKGARVKKGETVVVLGAGGKVGEASMQLAYAAGAQVIGVSRNTEKKLKEPKVGVNFINLSKEPDLKTAIMSKTDGKGANIIMNCVGSPYFEVANDCLSKEGRHIIISTLIEENKFNLRKFYRGNHQMIGVSNMDHDHIVSAEILKELRPGFEDGTYKPYEIAPNCVFGLGNIVEAYNLILNDKTRDRVAINPQLN